MDSKSCVNCDNTSAVNATDNRLVTESCGHVKCIQCLLKETAGCEACKRAEGSLKPNGEFSNKTEQKCVILDSGLDKNKQEHSQLVKVDVGGLGAEFGLTVVDEAVQTDIEERNELCSDQINEKLNGNFKLNTSHIVIFKDGESKCYLCTLCDRKFTARSQVTYHAYCNGQKKPFECKDCNRSFATLSHYKYHRQSKHPTMLSNQKFYSCNVCNAKFIQKSKLKRHNLKHTKEKMYRCKECEKSFNNRSALRKHGLMHSGRQPYACPHCLRRFRDSSNLRKHVYNKHSTTDKTRSPGSESQECVEPRSYVRRLHTCAHCSKSFHSRKDLRRHEDIHTEDKPFVCPIRDSKCKQPRFRRRDNYNRHLRNTHGVLGPLASDNSEPNETEDTNGTNEKVPDEIQEKAKLEVLNPLPPLPEDVIQKHLYNEEKTAERTIDNAQPAIDKTSEQNAILNENTPKFRDKIEVPVINKSEERAIDKTVPVLDKSYIIEANNARESVICKARERFTASPAPAYVHKLKIANSLSHKDVCLPPIDTRKFVELVTLYPHSKEEPPRALDASPLLVKDVQTLKNILHDHPPARNPAHPAPALHWRKKRLATDNDHEQSV